MGDAFHNSHLDLRLLMVSWFIFSILGSDPLKFIFIKLKVVKVVCVYLVAHPQTIRYDVVSTLTRCCSMKK